MVEQAIQRRVDVIRVVAGGAVGRVGAGQVVEALATRGRFLEEMGVE